MRWTGRVARIEAMSTAYKIVYQNPEGGDKLGDLGTDGRVFKEIGCEGLCVLDLSCPG
jgi:hypothetical protein